jgi:predicted membrane metal-binding protein
MKYKLKNRLIKNGVKLNLSPIWHHTMLFLFLYGLEMLVFVAIFIYRYFIVGFVGEALKVWLIMTVPLIIAWLILGLRNYYINKKIGIWKHFQNKTRKEKLID